MGKKLFLSIALFFIVICLHLTIGEIVARISLDNFYYLPRISFWRLDLHTNLAGQYDGKDQLCLEGHYNECFYFKKPEKVKRVIILGGSAAYAGEVPIEQRDSTLLGEKLDSLYGKDRYEVMNFGLPGYTSFQTLVFFQEVLIRLSPDVVILYSGRNDGGYPGLLTDREYYSRVNKLVARFKNNKEKLNLICKYGLNGLNPLYRLISESRLTAYLYHDFFRKSTFWAKMRAVLRVPDIDKEYVLKEFINLAKKHGFLLIFVPEARNFARDDYALVPAYSLMKKLSDQEGVIFLDINPIFGKYDGNTVFSDDVHLTALGNSLLAEEFFRIIQKEYGQE